jgi:5-methylcytosine-specific restriction protein A
MKVSISEESHFIAHYLAKYVDSYDTLNLGNNTQTHNAVCEVLDITESSFRRLRDEYDGFYENRKGFPNPESRKSRVEYKSRFEKIEQNEYLKEIKSILLKNKIDIKFDEISSDEILYEGGKVRIEINRYERSSKAKKECLKHYNRKCVLCGFEDRTSKYTNIDIIEVHHLKPISEITEKYIVNPIEDLRPVCPNCHRALHSKNPAYSIEELKIVLNNNC